MQPGGAKPWADWEAEWQGLSEEVNRGMADWRAAHPRTTFAGIEAAVEERLAGGGRGCWSGRRWRARRPT